MAISFRPVVDAVAAYTAASIPHAAPQAAPVGQPAGRSPHQPTLPTVHQRRPVTVTPSRAATLLIGVTCRRNAERTEVADAARIPARPPGGLTSASASRPPRGVAQRACRVSLADDGLPTVWVQLGWGSRCRRLPRPGRRASWKDATRTPVTKVRPRPRRTPGTRAGGGGPCAPPTRPRGRPAAPYNGWPCRPRWPTRRNCWSRRW